MYICKKLLWMEDYLELSSKYVPRVRYIRRISSKVPKSDLTENQNCAAITTKYSCGKDYRITFYLKYISIERMYPKALFKIRSYSTIDLLQYLAHELAHVHEWDWDHCTNHKSMETKLMKLFMKKLYNDGYISEEKEFQSRRRFYDQKSD